jgi:hypothetical protein
MNKSLLLAGVAIAAALAVVIIVARPGTGPKVPAVAVSPASSASPASPASPAGTSAVSGALKAREASFDFGAISMAAGNVSHRYWFRNEGTTPILISKIYTSCMCTTAALVKGGRMVNRFGMPGHGVLPKVAESLAPGEAAYIEAVFDPAAHGPAGLGRTERVVTIEHDAGGPLELRFVADVRP